MADIAVVIPAYNAARYIAEAIESVLAQTLPPAEIIVVDDGSTDATAEVAGGFPGVMVLRQAHRGVSAARNAAVEASRAPFIAFLDADDIWLPRKLEVQWEFGGHHPAPGVVMARQVYHFEGPIPAWFRGPTDGGWEPGLVPSNWYLPRETWRIVGPFDERLTHSEDTDWLARASNLGVSTVTVPEILVVRRIHGGNASAQAAAVRAGILRTLRSSVQRKRELANDE